LLDEQLAEPHSSSLHGTDTTRGLSELVADQAQRLDAERRRREALERRVEKLAANVADANTELSHKSELLDRLQNELEALEACFKGPCARDEARSAQRLTDTTVLYVGGRAGSVSHLRKIAAATGAALLSHDGGIEERCGVLSGLVARADVVLFPVDCVSHEAAAIIKRACRHLSKPFMALRSSGISSFAAALRQIESEPVAVS
jgi:Tfp pilus assembly protein FimV